MDEKQTDAPPLTNKENDSSEDHGSAASGSSVTNSIPLRVPMDRSSPYFVIPSVAASPPQFISMEEIMSAANGLKNMQLAHEIVVNEEFKLEPYQPPENSLERVIKDAMHRAFWDLLSEELNKDPPVYTRAMILLEEVKTILLELLLPHSERMKQEINEMLDIPFITQQAENGALDFLGYARFVINIMARMCAPVRDEKIEELRGITDPIEVFKGVFETLTLMRLDFANFNIEMCRSDLMAQSVDYEKKAFEKAINLHGGVDSLEATKNWLRRHLQKTPSGAEKDIVLSAYLELFELKQLDEFPDTVLMDFERLKRLGQRLQKLILSGTVLLVTLYRAKSPALQQSTRFKEKLMHHVGILLQDVKDDENLKNVLPNVAVQVINDVKNLIKQETTDEQSTLKIDSEFEQSLTELIQEIHLPHHNVRKIIRERTFEFIRRAISSPRDIPTQLPPGMSAVQSELLSVTGSIVRIYQFNLAVFNEYYVRIIAKLREESTAAP